MSTDKYRIEHSAEGRYLRVTGDLPDGFHGEKDGDSHKCPLDARNAAAIRAALPWTAPQTVGLRKSVGCGDRLGIASPGHVRAVNEGDMFPVFAQQSIREMQRAHRSPQDVIDDATWGVLQAGYTEGFGSDADHLKTTADIDACVAAGYVGFTFDPGAYVDDEAHTADRETLVNKVAALPWRDLDTDAETHRLRYSGLSFDEVDYLRAAAKYGGAVAHVARMTAHLRKKMGYTTFDLEISVDETATVTSLEEHRFIALELKRLVIPFTGLAPRFVGDFEKGVDYIGDLTTFEESFKQHAELAQQLGPYKLSIHSGSDKFSIYPIIARHANPYVHLKTAGTSWLEALRVIAAKDAPLFREILKSAIDGYTQNSASYHVSAKPEQIAQDLPDEQLPTLLEDFHARETLHVAFGAALETFGARIMPVLHAQHEAYFVALHRHFNKHIAPFA